MSASSAQSKEAKRLQILGAPQSNKPISAKVPTLSHLQRKCALSRRADIRGAGGTLRNSANRRSRTRHCGIVTPRERPLRAESERLLPTFQPASLRRARATEGAGLEGAKSDGQGMDNAARLAVLLPEEGQRHRQAEAAGARGARVQPKNADRLLDAGAV